MSATLAAKIAAVVQRDGPRDALQFQHLDTLHIVSIAGSWWIEIRPAGPLARWLITEYRAGGIVTSELAACDWSVVTWLSRHLRNKLAGNAVPAHQSA